MSGGGAGDRRGFGAHQGAAGGRPVPSPPVVRAARARLLGLDGAEIATVRVVIADSAPLVIMFDGDPFLHEHGNGDMLLYAQTQPYRVDAGAIESGGGA